MKSKRLDKTRTVAIEKFLNRKANLLEKFEDLIEDTVFEEPYYATWRKLRFSSWNPKTAYYRVKKGVQNLIKWFPIIWNDRDWDWHYWLEMNIKKLGDMEKTIREHGCHVHHIRDADTIRKAVLALKRLEADDYHENAFVNHNKKWGKLKVSWGDKDKNNCREWLSNRDGAVTDKEKEQERKETRRLFKHSDYMQRQDLEYATSIINKYLFHWWD